MKWRCQMCGTIVEADKEPYDCTGCKFKKRYQKYEDPDYFELKNKKGHTVRVPKIKSEEIVTIYTDAKTERERLKRQREGE